MKILDRYVCRLFLINFLILLFVVIALFVVIDLVLNLDEFLDAGQQHAGRFAGTTWATLWAIADFHGPMTPLLYVFLSGLVVVGAMGFTFASLVRTGELAAAVTSGVSMYRLSASVLVVGGLLNLLALPIQELIIPPLAPKLARSHAQVGKAGLYDFAVIYSPDSLGNLFSAVRFDPGLERMSSVHILVRQGGVVVRRISAEQAFWDESRQGWELIQGHGLSPQPAGPSAEGFPLAIEHQRGPQLLPSEEAADVPFVRSDLSPKALLARRASIYPRLLSLHELRQLTQSQAVDADSFRQIMHSRFSMMVVNMLILVMSLPFFLLREPANLMLQAVKAAATSLGAWGCALVILQMGAGQFNPAMAAWMPVVIFLPLSAVLLTTIKT